MNGRLQNRYFSTAYFEWIPLRRWWFWLENLLRCQYGTFQLLHKEILPAVHVPRIAQRRLHHTTVPFAVANRMYLIRVDQPPKVILIIAAVQPNPQPRAENIDYGSDAGGCDAAWIERFQFHADLEFVWWWLVGLLETRGRRGLTVCFLFAIMINSRKTFASHRSLMRKKPVLTSKYSSQSNPWKLSYWNVRAACVLTGLDRFTAVALAMLPAPLLPLPLLLLVCRLCSPALLALCSLLFLLVLLLLLYTLLLLVDRDDALLLDAGVEMDFFDKSFELFDEEADAVEFLSGPLSERSPFIRCNGVYRDLIEYVIPWTDFDLYRWSHLQLTEERSMKSAAHFSAADLVLSH